MHSFCGRSRMDPVHALESFVVIAEDLEHWGVVAVLVIDVA